MKLSDLIKAAKREAGMRRAVYPNRVESGKMKAATAEHETACMDGIVQILETIRDYPLALAAVTSCEGISFDPEPPAQQQLL